MRNTDKYVKFVYFIEQLELNFQKYYTNLNSISYIKSIRTQLHLLLLRMFLNHLLYFPFCACRLTQIFIFFIKFFYSIFLSIMLLIVFLFYFSVFSNCFFFYLYIEFYLN